MTQRVNPHVEVTMLYGLVGMISGGVLGTFGIMMITILLDVTCTPPLKEVGNYGQFGMTMLLSGPFYLFVGASMTFLTVVPVRFWIGGFAFAFLIFKAWTWTETWAEWNDVYFAANCVCFAIMLTVAIVAPRFGRKLLTERLADPR